MKRHLLLGAILLVAVATVALPGYSHAGARISVPFPGGHVVVNPDGSGGVRFPGGGVSWPGAGGAGRAAPAPPPQPRTNELQQLESERNRLESDIREIDELLDQPRDGEERSELLRERRELERKLNQVVMKIERLRSSRR